MDLPRTNRAESFPTMEEADLELDDAALQELEAIEGFPETPAEPQDPDPDPDSSADYPDISSGPALVTEGSPTGPTTSATGTPSVGNGNGNGSTGSAAAATSPTSSLIDRTKKLRQQRRASMKVNLQLQALNMQFGSTAASTSLGATKARRRQVLNSSTANKLKVQHTGTTLAGEVVTPVERRRAGAVSNAGAQVLRSETIGSELPEDTASQLVNAHSQQVSE